MKEYLKELVQKASSTLAARNRMREYLQARILGCLQRSGAMIPLAFHGGTALRFLYSIARYSEDLDFALERGETAYNFKGLLSEVRSEFTAEGYRLEIKANEAKTVQHAFVRFPGLLFELGLSNQTNENFSVKLQVDTHPPAGAKLETTLVRRFVILQLQHHSRASLLAGKLRAILQRPYVKGRDIYDLVWYLSDPEWPEPNLTHLNNALAQTSWDGPEITPQNWRATLTARLNNLNWSHIRQDVQPFLETSTDAALLNQENLNRLLK